MTANGYRGDLEADGVLRRGVLHALQAHRTAAERGYTCDACARLYPDRLPRIMVTTLMGRRPVGVVVHLCGACRAELEGESEAVTAP